MKEDIEKRIEKLKSDQEYNMERNYRQFEINEYKIEHLERLLDLFED